MFLYLQIIQHMCIYIYTYINIEVLTYSRIRLVTFILCLVEVFFVYTKMRGNSSLYR